MSTLSSHRHVHPRRIFLALVLLLCCGASSVVAEHADEWWETGIEAFVFTSGTITPLKFRQSEDGSTAAIVGSVSSGTLLLDPPLEMSSLSSAFLFQVNQGGPGKALSVITSTLDFEEDFILPTDLTTKGDSSFVVTGHFKAKEISSTHILADGLATNVFQIELDSNNVPAEAKKLTDCQFSPSLNQRASAVSGAVTAKGPSVTYVPGTGTCKDVKDVALVSESPSPTEYLSRTTLITATSRFVEERTIELLFSFNVDNDHKSLKLHLEGTKDASFFHVNSISTGYSDDSSTLVLFTGTVPPKSDLTIMGYSESTIEAPSFKGLDGDHCSWYLAVWATNSDKLMVIAKEIVCTTNIVSSIFSPLSNSFWLSADFTSSDKTHKFGDKACSSTDDDKQQVALIQMNFPGFTRLQVESITCSKSDVPLFAGPIVERTKERTIQVAAVSHDDNDDKQTLKVFDFHIPQSSLTPAQASPLPDPSSSSSSSSSPEKSSVSTSTKDVQNNVDEDDGKLETAGSEPEQTGSLSTIFAFGLILIMIGTAVGGFYFYKKRRQDEIYSVQASQRPDLHRFNHLEKGFTPSHDV